MVGIIHVVEIKWLKVERGRKQEIDKQKDREDKNRQRKQKKTRERGGRGGG